MGGRVVVLGDSVAVASPGRSYAELLASALRHSRPAEAMHRVGGDPPIIASLASVDEVAAFQPDVVLVAHGGAEILLTPRIVVAASLQGVGRGREAANKRVTGPTRRLVKPILRRSPMMAPQLAAPRIGQAIDELVTVLLQQVAAPIVLISPPAPDFARVMVRRRDYVSVEDSYRCLARSRGLPLLDPNRWLRGWQDYASDRAHLRASGHEAIAAGLKALLESR